MGGISVLPKGHLVAGATYLRLRLRCQLIARATYPRFSTPFQDDSMMLPAGPGLALR